MEQVCIQCGAMGNARPSQLMWTCEYCGKKQKAIHLHEKFGANSK